VQLGPPQRLVGVDVADAGHQRLVEQRSLQLGLLPAQRGDRGGHREVRVHRVAADVRDRGRQPGAVDGHEVVDEEAAEGALVDEPQLRAAVGEVEPDAQVLLVGCAFRLDQQLAAHAEMGEQRDVRVRLVGQLEPQVLAPALGRGDRAPGEPAGEVGRAEQVPPDRPRVEHPDGRDRAAGDMPIEACAHHLDLG
jgi:hypothetical protein